MLLELKNYFSKIKNSLPGHLWIFLAVILVGIFLRTYNFHAWLDFGSDQVKDINVVNSVVVNHSAWPSYGPDMSHSGAGGHGSRRFLIGPMYYYFEIFSALLFGNYPDKLAYPDLLFSILSLPLFFYFLRKIFSVNLSLALTGLYAISFYALSFSHSAWNVNSIPFFSLLFLLSLYEFILAKEKTHWGWIIALGISLGVSTQLHAILLVLFPATLFFAWLLFMRKNLSAWKKLAVVILLMLILNLGQIVGESRSGFRNTNTFLISLASPRRNDNSVLLKAIGGLSCQFQANAYMAAVIGDDTCDDTLLKGLTHKIRLREVLFDKDFFALEISLSALFSLIGYGLLISYFRREKQVSQKQFLGLLLVYVAISFLVLFPLEVDLFRYFVHTFFVPLVFLGLLARYLFEKFSSNKIRTVVWLLFLFLALSNLIATGKIASVYATKNRTDLDIIVLGELEATLDYLTANAGGAEKIGLLCNRKQAVFCGSLDYVAQKRNVPVSRISDDVTAFKGVQLFFVGPTPDNFDNTIIKK